MTRRASTPFLFIVGSGRSGTTMLRAMLDSHPELDVPPESHFIPALVAQRVRFERAGGVVVQLLCRALQANRWFVRWGLDAVQLRVQLSDAAPSTLAHAIRGVYGLYALAREKPRFADKTRPTCCPSRSSSRSSLRRVSFTAPGTAGTQRCPFSTWRSALMTSRRPPLYGSAAFAGGVTRVPCWATATFRSSTRIAWPHRRRHCDALATTVTSVSATRCSTTLVEQVRCSQTWGASSGMSSWGRRLVAACEIGGPR
jgi:hypothetical protein